MVRALLGVTVKSASCVENRPVGCDVFICDLYNGVANSNV